MFGYKIFGICDLGARFFPAASALVAVVMTWFFLRRTADPPVAFAAAVILALCPAFWYVAHAVITDMTLLCAFAAALFAFYIGYTEKRRYYYTVSSIALALGVLTKGPVGFVLPAIIIFIFLITEKRLDELPRIFTLPRIILFMFITGLWYFPMLVMHGLPFLSQLIGVHNLLRAVVSEHPLFDIWYYYLLVFLIGFMPWHILPLISLVKNGLPRLGRLNRFLIIWAAVVFLFFQLVATKYPTYTFPYVIPCAVFFAQYYLAHYDLFKKIAAFMAVVLFLFNFLAIPIVSRNSGAAAAEIILPISENACVVSYQRIYSGSITFYSGLKVYRLETAAKVAALKPDGITWNAVNVMPFMSFEELPAGKVIAVVDKDRVEDLFIKSGRSWRLVKELPAMSIYITDNFF